MTSSSDLASLRWKLASMGSDHGGTAPKSLRGRSLSERASASFRHPMLGQLQALSHRLRSLGMIVSYKIINKRT